MVFKPNTDNELKMAVDIWCINKEKALKEYGEINTWNTINIKSMVYLFEINFNDDVSNWNTANVTNAICTFYKCKEFNHPLNNWDTSNITDMSSMFYGCEKFNQDLDNWNLKNLKQCNKMFHGCNSYSYPLFSWTDYDIIMNTQIFDRAINKKIV